MARMSESDYLILEKFVQTAIRRVCEGKADIMSTQEDVMYALTAWDHGNIREFVPWMRLRLNNWADEDA